jgi:hypothetical protein
MTATSPPLHRLLYRSRQTPATAADLAGETRRIVDSAMRNNGLLGLTGILVTIQGYFIQTLEGPLDDVKATYRRILVDPRHCEATVIHAGPTDRRLFQDWNMCARALTSADQKILDVLDAKGPFDATRITPLNALKLLTTVADIQRRTAAAA